MESLIAVTDTKTKEQSGSRRSGTERTCVGCGQVDTLDALIRVVLHEIPNPSAGAFMNAVVVDAKGGQSGRGARVHPQPACVARACKGGFSKAFRRQVQADVSELCEAIRAALTHRVQGLLVAARGARLIEVGADAACEALRAGAPLAVVARDAASVVTREPLARAIAEGRAVVWEDKAALGRACGRQDVAVVAVCDGRIAAEIRRACVAADAVLSRVTGSESC